MKKKLAWIILCHFILSEFLIFYLFGRSFHRGNLYSWMKCWCSAEQAFSLCILLFSLCHPVILAAVFLFSLWIFPLSQSKCKRVKVLRCHPPKGMDARKLRQYSIKRAQIHVDESYHQSAFAKWNFSNRPKTERTRTHTHNTTNSLQSDEKRTTQPLHQRSKRHKVIAIRSVNAVPTKIIDSFFCEQLRFAFRCLITRECI